MRFYKLNGVWQSWDYLHNELGYAEHATRPTVFKSCADATWGEDAGNGYYDGDVSDMINGTFWTDADPTAWFDLSGLVYNAEVYPADATDCAMEKDGVRSDAVSIESDGVTYYLIRNVWDSGWMSESEAAAEGWEPAQPGPALPVVYTHTGTQTAASIAPDSSFDTGLTYDSNNLYIGETDDGLGDVTRYGWEAEEGPEPPAYTEIMLYMVSGQKDPQTGVTSAFTGNVNSSSCYQLYTDEECTIKWTGYDYSNDYKVGTIPSSGVWTEFIDSVAEMPDYVGSGTDFKVGRILLDTGFLWFCCNLSSGSSVTTSTSKIVVHIYPKGQQYYAAYFQSNDAYSNNSFTAQSVVAYTSPTAGSNSRMYGINLANNATLDKVIGSAGNDCKLSGDYVGQTTTSGNSWFKFFQESSGVSRNARCFTFVLHYPTFVAWVSSNYGNVAVSSGTLKRLIDSNGNYIQYDPNKKYTALSINGTSQGVGTINLYEGLYGIGCDDNYPGELCFKQVYGQISLNRIWIMVEPVDQYIWAYFTASGESATTNTSITSGNAYLLYDANGNAIVYDPSKAYETLELQYHTSNGYLMRGNTKFDTYSDNGNGQLQAIARFTNTSNGARRIKIGMKPQPYAVEVNFGAAVTIPAGYEVESVTCSRGYAFVSNVSSESSIMGQFVHYELSGEKVYFDETNTALVGVGVVPALQIFALTSLNNTGRYVSTSSGTSASYLTSASASYLNSDGYFVKGVTAYNDSDVMNKVVSGMQTFPVFFNLSDSSGNWLYFCFRVPQTLWQFQNGTFTWLGDTTDASDLAYWYNTRAVQINLRPITT